ncbi:diphthine Sase [Enterospora canceri]|uniref:diphthine methyl ester synthase n=1 Tax=Enterospora canceri TaxID=1081671 RepID=A0A1Y1S6L6_9MICR|nr:diphthine Sase [Enterospora canceri]
MLFIIGTGLNNARDLSLNGLDRLKKCDKIYLECYTCIQRSGSDELEKLIGKEVIRANRRMVEETSEIVDEAKSKSVAFLVAGSPLFATTHGDILVRAKEAGVETRILHNVSILSVVGCYGLCSYNFGRTVSVCYFTETWKPTSFYDRILMNQKSGLHTLCLLDIKTDENRFMTANEALEQMVYAESQLKYGILGEETRLFVVCRFATDSESVYYDTLSNLIGRDFGEPLHSIIFPGELSVVEQEFVGKLNK